MTRPIQLRLQATRYPHWGRYTGVGQFARYLDRSRFRVTERLAADDDSGLPIPWRSLRNRLRSRVQRDGMAWYKLSDLAAEVRALGSVVSGRAEVVHFLDGEHGVQFLPAWRDRISARTKIVGSFHQPPELLPGLVSPQVLAKLDRLVLIAPNQLDYFARYVSPERISTILHGIDTEFFRPHTCAVTARETLRCLTVGHWLRDWTAMAGTVELLKSHREIEFHVVTGASTGLEGLPNVCFHNGLDDLELRALNQSADIILLPFTQSTANNSLLEGMACGVPVISTDLLSVRTYTGADAAILVEKNDSSQLAAAILTLQAQPERRAAMGAAARRRALELAWPRVTREYERMYQELVEC